MLTRLSRGGARGAAGQLQLGRRVIPTITPPSPSSTTAIASVDHVVLLPVEGSCTGPAEATTVVVVESAGAGPPEATELLGATLVVVGAALVVGAIVVVVVVPGSVVVVVVVGASVVVVVVVVGASVVVVVVGSVVVVVSQYGSLGSHGDGSQSGLLHGIDGSVSHGGWQSGWSAGIFSSHSQGSHDESYGSHGPLAASSYGLSSAWANVGTITNPATAMRPAIETRLKFIVCSWLFHTTDCGGLVNARTWQN
jgi:hypothetical protein